MYRHSKKVNKEINIISQQFFAWKKIPTFRILRELPKPELKDSRTLNVKQTFSDLYVFGKSMTHTGTKKLYYWKVKSINRLAVFLLRKVPEL